MTRRITLTALALALLIGLAQWRLEHPVKAQALPAYPLNPDEFTSLGGSPFASGTYTINTSMNNAAPSLSGPGITTPIAGVFFSPSGGSVARDEIAVFTFASLSIPAGVTVQGAQNANSRPMALLSQSTATVAGTINVSGAGGESGGGGDGGAAGPGGGGGGGGNSAVRPLGAAAGRASSTADPGSSASGGAGGSVEPGGGGIGSGLRGGGGGAFGGEGLGANGPRQPLRRPLPEAAGRQRRRWWRRRGRWRRRRRRRGGDRGRGRHQHRRDGAGERRLRRKQRLRRRRRGGPGGAGASSSTRQPCRSPAA